MEGQQTNSQTQPLNNSGNDNGTGDSGSKAKSLVVQAKEKYSPGIKIGLLIFLGVYFALLVVGAYGVNKCSIEPYIPLFLIATGGVGLLSKFLTYIREHIVLHLDVKYIETTLYAVECVFFILGSYWVYTVYPPNYNPNIGREYCDKTVYLVAFVYLTALYAIAVAILSGFACFLVCICFLKTTEAIETDDVEAQTNTETAENVETKPKETKEPLKETITTVTVKETKETA